MKVVEVISRCVGIPLISRAVLRCGRTSGDRATEPAFIDVLQTKNSFAASG